MHPLILPLRVCRAQGPCVRLLTCDTGMSILKYVSVSGTKRRKMSDSDQTKNEPHGSGASPMTDVDFQFVQAKGDLFSCSDSTSLAHCISEDVRMGKGIAVLFKQKFGGVRELQEQGKKPGDVAVLKRGDRYVYYLITKEKYWQKPTYKTVQTSLEAMKSHIEEKNVRTLAMPRIGCGLDGLQWPKVSDIIREVFSGTSVKITVYTL